MVERYPHLTITRQDERPTVKIIEDNHPNSLRWAECIYRNMLLIPPQVVGVVGEEQIYVESKAAFLGVT
jgi:hypothetical protein